MEASLRGVSLNIPQYLFELIRLVLKGQDIDFLDIGIEFYGLLHEVIRISLFWLLLLKKPFSERGGGEF